MSKRPIKIATAQSQITPDVREIRRLMQQARSQGTAVVHLPEAAMSGCSKAQVKNWDHVDWDSLVSELQSTEDLARKLGLWVVVGGERPSYRGEPRCNRERASTHR